MRWPSQRRVAGGVIAAWLLDEKCGNWSEIEEEVYKGIMRYLSAQRSDGVNESMD